MDEDIQDAAIDAAKQNAEAARKFDILFIDNWEKLFKFDFSSFEIEKVEIKELHESICDEARRLAGIGE